LSVYKLCFSADKKPVPLDLQKVFIFPTFAEDYASITIHLTQKECHEYNKKNFSIAICHRSNMRSVGKRQGPARHPDRVGRLGVLQF
jgi:hypothetical protein